MKIVLTGGGTGGHFYPLISVAQEINSLVAEHQLVKPELYYLSNAPYDEQLLFENEITYKHIFSGKMRTYLSLKNGIDFFRTLFGIPHALYVLYKIWPDIVFSKGGYVSVPVTIAARILRIPVFVHDSDSVPGRANLLAGKWAARIAISYPEAVDHFKYPKRVAYTGNPIRKEVKIPATRDAHAHFEFVPDVPVVVIVGGSQGAEAINSTVLQSIKELVKHFQVIHQVGEANVAPYKELARVELKGHEHAHRYRVFGTLNAEQLRHAAGCADIFISRAGSGSIFEIANWEVPSILVPIPGSVSRDQRENAYAYARTGAAEVIEQENFTPHVVHNELSRILADKELLATMRAAAREFKRPDAGRDIAQEIMKIILKHEV
jgi:UDP-N-acetylglucosamine--N-acetylmuramyl-(pentapeptide) pyrophosphoryl-undecaprenol N-acetylglucosamine transferase